MSSAIKYQMEDGTVDIYPQQWPQNSERPRGNQAPKEKRVVRQAEADSSAKPMTEKGK